MKTIGISALAVLAALVLGLGAFRGTQVAQADVDATVVIPCEFLLGAIDGNPDNAPNDLVNDLTEACLDGEIDEADQDNLAAALGDEDDKLEASDFEDIDLDDNQIVDDGGVVYGTTLIFAFVDNDGTVTFNADAGVTVDNFGGSEDCTTEDPDCDDALDDGNGVVVATVSDGSADPGDEVDVDVEQDDQGDTVTLLITGAPDSLEAEAILGKTVVQETGSDTEAGECMDDLDVTDTDQLFEPNITGIKVTVTDDDDVVLTRAKVVLDTDDADRIDIPDESSEDGDEPSFDTGESVNAGDVAGTAFFAFLCGGDETGDVTITAFINFDTDTEEDADVDFTVVGAPDSVTLTANPAQIACDGTQTSTVTATVVDSEGNNVADGTDVTFSVVALGTSNPINAITLGGTATSVITPLSGATAGVTVVVEAGGDDQTQASIRIDCSLPVPTATSAVPAPTARPGGAIGGPDTGNGGYLAQDSSAGFPMWTLVALALGSVALVAGGFVTRKVTK